MEFRTVRLNTGHLKLGRERQPAPAPAGAWGIRTQHSHRMHSSTVATRQQRDTRPLARGPARARPTLAPMLLLLLSTGVSGDGALANRDRQLAPARWWCKQSEHASSTFCKTAMLKDAIAMASAAAERQAKVDELRAAILAGNAEAEGLDATNPERQLMMEAWCSSDDPARTGDKKSAFMCAKAKAKSEFYKRREVRACDAAALCPPPARPPAQRLNRGH
jgi:hypothetical protein